MAEYTYSQLISLAEQGGWPAALAPIAAAIAMAESSGISTQKNYSNIEHSVGLWQVNMDAHPQYNEAYLLNPLNNARAAWAVYQEAGNSFKPWTMFKNGEYKKYLAGNTSTPVDTSTQTSTSTEGWIPNISNPLDIVTPIVKAIQTAFNPVTWVNTIGSSLMNFWLGLWNQFTTSLLSDAVLVVGSIIALAFILIGAAGMFKSSKAGKTVVNIAGTAAGAATGGAVSGVAMGKAITASTQAASDTASASAPARSIESGQQPQQIQARIEGLKASQEFRKEKGITEQQAIERRVQARKTRAANKAAKGG